MKTTISTALAISGALASSSLSAASLTIPMAFEFIALNGQMLERSIVFHNEELEFAPGHHEIAMRYYDMVESNVSDTPESVESAAFIVTLDATDDGDYVLAPAVGEVIRNPQEFALAPQVVITREDGRAAEYTFTQTDVDSHFSTRLYAATVVPTEAAPAAPAPSASVDVIEDATVSAPAPELPPVDTSGASSADMLRLWWQRADEKTRKDFLNWAINQL